MKIVLCMLLLASLFGCKSYQEAQELKHEKKYTSWLLSHDKLNSICARIYPAKDSLGKPDTLYIPSDSPDYTKLIDSLYQELNHPDTSGWEQRGVFVEVDSTEYWNLKNKLFRLQNQVFFLRDNYRPCDSARIISIPTFITDEAAVSKLKSQIDEKDKSISVTQEKINNLQDKVSKEDKWKLYFFILLSLNVIVFLVRLFIKIKKP